LREISAVAALCSSTAEAMVSEILLTSPMIFEIRRIAAAEFSVEFWMERICSPISPWPSRSAWRGP